jgi:hypothetical protein
MIVWLNGAHGAGKTTTAALVQPLIPDSRVLDAEKVGETLMNITPGLPETDNFQHRPPWRQLVVETARRVLDHAEAARTWLHGEAEVVDTTQLTPAEAASRIAESVDGGVNRWGGRCPSAT